MAHRHDRHLGIAPDTLGKRYQSMLLVAWQRVTNLRPTRLAMGSASQRKHAALDSAGKQAMAKSHWGWFYR